MEIRCKAYGPHIDSLQNMVEFQLPLNPKRKAAWSPKLSFFFAHYLRASISVAVSRDKNACRRDPPCLRLQIGQRRPPTRDPVSRDDPDHPVIGRRSEMPSADWSAAEMPDPGARTTGLSRSSLPAGQMVTMGTGRWNPPGNPHMALFLTGYCGRLVINFGKR